MTSDIRLERDRIEAVASNDAALEVTTSEGAEPDIRLAPNSAALRLGGGDGDYSDGDVRLMDRPGDDGESAPRIHLTGGRGATDRGTRVRVNGSDGTARLGATSADDPDIELRPGDGEISLGGGAGRENEAFGSVGSLRLDTQEGDPRVFIAAGGIAPPNRDENAVYVTTGFEGNGRISLKRAEDAFQNATVTLDAGASQLTLGGSTGSGDLLMYRSGLVNSVYVDGHEADVFVGGTDPDEEEGVPGTIEVRGDRGEAAVTIRGDHGDGNGGGISLSDGAGLTADLAAEGGAVSLGHRTDADGEVELRLDPEGGVFSIVDADGDVVFKIDTQEEAFYQAKRYDRRTILHES